MKYDKVTKKPIIIGHRGAPHNEPENTLKSFKKALDQKVDMIELDVHLTKDKKLIIMHDSDLSRMTYIDKKIKKLTLKDLKKITIKGETIPTLEEAIDFLKGKCKIMIESKVRSAAEYILKIIKEKGISEQVIIASSDYIFLKKIKNIDPFIKTSLIIRRPTLGYILTAKLLGLYSIQPHINITTRRMIKRAHKNNLKVYVWWLTYPLWKINIKKIRNLQPDGIITHDPNIQI